MQDLVEVFGGARRFLAGLLGCACLVASVIPAAATCDAVVNCSGNISGGVSYDGNSVTTLNVNSLTVNVTPSGGVSGLALTARADDGHNGHDGGVGIGVQPGDNGIDANTLTLTYAQPGANPSSGGSGAIVTTNASGIVVTARGGNGGSGGDAYVAGNGRGGGDGGAGGTVTVSATGAISTSGNSAAGLVAASVGGDGGNGGDSAGVGGSGGNGGEGGHASAVSVTLNGSIRTNGSDANGISAVSRGGAGGSAGDCAGIYCGSSSAGGAAYGSSVNVTTLSPSAIETFGTYSNGIYAASIGGFAGNGGSSYGVVAFGSSSASAGDGGTVTVNNAGSITTHAANSYGIFAQSVGGGGGGGGSSGGLVSLGGSGSSGGNGGTVSVTNSGAIATSAANSVAIFAQSIGGSGGDGGNSGGLVSLGGNGSSTTPGGNVTVSNTGTLTTLGRGFTRHLRAKYRWRRR